jgi:hypothetical protein
MKLLLLLLVFGSVGLSGCSTDAPTRPDATSSVSTGGDATYTMHFCTGACSAGIHRGRTGAPVVWDPTRGWVERVEI